MNVEEMNRHQSMRERAERAEAERDAAHAKIFELRADYIEADEHIAECQELLVEHGLSVGGDGSLLFGMGRLVKQRDAAIALVRRLVEALSQCFEDAAREGCGEYIDWQEVKNALDAAKKVTG